MRYLADFGNKLFDKPSYTFFQVLHSINQIRTNYQFPPRGFPHCVSPLRLVSLTKPGGFHVHFVFKGEGTDAAPRKRGRSTERGRGKTPFFWGGDQTVQCKPMDLCCRDLAFNIVHLIVWRVCNVICHHDWRWATTPNLSHFCTNNHGSPHHQPRRDIVGYEDGMSPSQLEDELDAAGLKVMEVGDISPPTMEAFRCFFVRKWTGHPLAKGGGVRWWYRWLGT